ncbi:MAG: PaaI family thioesterase [Anaerolineae bacterium]
MNDEQTAVAVHRFMSERDRLAQHLGIELVEVRPGYCRTTMTMAPHLLNGHGLLHGAAVFALADVAFAAACNSSGQTALALSMDIHFVATPRPDAVLTAVAREIRRGSRTALCRMTVTDDEENLIAELHGMAYRKGENFLDTEGTE